MNGPAPIREGRSSCAYLTYYDATQLRYWSGSGRRIMDAAAAAGMDVTNLFCYPPPTPWERLLRFAARRMGRGDPLLRRHSRLRRIGAGLDHQLSDGRWDLLLSPGTMQCAYLEHPAPLVYWIDGTFRVMRDYYEGLSGLSARAVRVNEELERRALRRAARVVCSSEWARRSVVDDYGVPSESTIVLPFGANLDAPPERAAVLGRDGATGPFRALLVGVEWARKGCDAAIAAVGLARASGLDIELDIAGCTPPEGASIPPYVRVHGFLDKSAPEGRDRIESLFRQADLFLLPTRAEAFGIVFCEAAAYGLPVVAFHTGGVPDVVLDGATGVLVDPSEGVQGLAVAIGRVFASPETRRSMSTAARDRFESDLNWGSISKRFADEVVAPLLAHPTRPA